MDNESEVIKQQIEETRSSLAEKLETLEQHVASTVISTTGAVTESVEAVKGAVEDTVQSVTESVANVKESVSDAFDFTKQMNAHPWLVMGGGVVVGYLGACLLERGAEELSHELSSRSVAPPPTSAPAYQSESRSQGNSSPEHSRPSTLNRLSEAFAPATAHLQGLAVGLLTSMVGKFVLENVPETLRDEVEKVIEEVNTAVGGKPLPDFLHDNPALARASAPPPR